MLFNPHPSHSFYDFDLGENKEKRQREKQEKKRSRKVEIFRSFVGREHVLPARTCVLYRYFVTSTSSGYVHVTNLFARVRKVSSIIVT